MTLLYCTGKVGLKRIFISLFGIVLVATMSTQPIKASTSNVDPEVISPQPLQNALNCYSLDIVFLIDQSLSMSRDDEPNDPLDQRVNAPRYALDWLANNRLNRMALCPDVIHRIGVISFGNEAEIDLEMTEIAPMSYDEWQPELNILAEKIEERKMGGTNPTNAFAMAKQMLSESGPLGPLPRKRAVVLLTDGQPCLTEGCIESEDQLKEFMRKLIDQVENDFPFSDAVKVRDEAVQEAVRVYGGADQIPDEVRNQIIVNYPVSNDEQFNSIYIWVVAMNDVKPYLDSIGAQFERIALDHNGDLFDLPRDPLAVPKIFNEIMSDLAELEPSLLSCGNLPVNPYLSGVLLDIYKAANGLEVEVKYEGKSIKNGEGDTDFFGLQQYSTYGAVEHYTFRTPPAGLWEIVCSDPNGADIAYLPFRAQLQMLQPGGILPHYDVDGALYDPVPSHQFFLEYRVMDQSTSLPLNLDPAYPLDMTAVITSPDGQQTDMLFDFTGDGVWVSRSPLPVNQMGTHQIVVSAYADCVADPERPEVCESPVIEVIPPTQGSYEVGNVSLFRIQVVSPEIDGVVPLHSGLIPDWLEPIPITVQVQLVDMDGRLLEADQVLVGNWADALDAELIAGEERITIDLTPDPTLSGHFTGRFELTEARGPHTLSVNISQEAYRFEKFRPLENPAVIQFVRQDPLLNNPMFYRLILVLLVIAVAGFVVYLIWLNTFPILGRLMFVKMEETGQKEVLLNLARRKRRFVLEGKTIPIDLKSDFKKIEVQNQPGQGRDPNIRAKVQVVLNKMPFTMVDGQSLMKAGWQITYTWGQPSRQRDRFILWAVIAVLISVVVVIGILLA